jgi:hypothetical protein
MSSLTLKGKPSEQASLASVTSSVPLTSTSSDASSGRQFDNCLVSLYWLIANLGFFFFLRKKKICFSTQAYLWAVG